jgi:hypothetical protein
MASIKNTSDIERVNIESDSESNDSGYETSEINEEESESDKEEITTTEVISDKKRGKKEKEKFEDIYLLMETLQNSIKLNNKKINDFYKEIKILEKENNDSEKQFNTHFKLLPKIYKDESNRIRKEKPKRKTNPNSGFNKEDKVPDILINFLGLEPDAVLRRPAVVSLLHSKFKELNLKNGKDTILDAATIKTLKLDKSYENKVIEFGRYQTFVASFYPSKDKNLVLM